MGSSSDKPRKPRRHLAKVPRGAEASNIHLAGLSNDSGAEPGHRVDHDKAHGRSEDIGKFGRTFLWLLGRRSKHPELEHDEEQS
ncbi:MAG TPA: hypothetical protein VND89_03125 [Acidimicrobiales bacterium]|nr:hypothetical protein [Acidimicrobiales bacterium]